MSIEKDPPHRDSNPRPSVCSIVPQPTTLPHDPDEVTGGWRKLHNEKLHNLYSSPNKSRMMKVRRMRWTGHVARIEERKNTCRLLVRKPEERRPRRRWVDNIKLILER
jgi:hypothetical protein